MVPENPGDSIQFASSIASFVSEEMSSPSQITAVAELMGCPTDEIQNLSIRYSKIKSGC